MHQSWNTCTGLKTVNWMNGGIWVRTIVKKVFFVFEKMSIRNGRKSDSNNSSCSKHRQLKVLSLNKECLKRAPRGIKETGLNLGHVATLSVCFLACSSSEGVRGGIFTPSNSFAFPGSHKDRPLSSPVMTRTNQRVDRLVSGCCSQSEIAKPHNLHKRLYFITRCQKRNLSLCCLKEVLYKILQKQSTTMINTTVCSHIRIQTAYELLKITCNDYIIQLFLPCT